jgi:hypothetical protein
MEGGCHVERSETSLVYFRREASSEIPEILRCAQNDIVFRWPLILRCPLRLSK